MAKIFKTFSKRLGEDTWNINLRIDGARVRRGGFRTWKDADKAITALKARHQAELYGIPLQTTPPTLDDLLEKREDDPLCQSTRNRRRLVGYFRDFVEELDPRMPIRDIRTVHLKEFRDRLQRAGLKNSTIEFKMAGVVGSLNAARQYFGELETFHAPTLQGLKVESREVLVERTELLALVTALRSESRYNRSRSVVADVLELLQLTGARVSEILSLERSQIDYSRRLLTLYGSKTHTKRTIPMSDSVERLLRERREKFPEYFNLQLTVRKFAERENIAFGSAAWTIHDIRHTAASVLAERHTSHSIIAALLGHRLAGMTARYTHATLPALKAASSELESYWLDKPTRLYAVA